MHVYGELAAASDWLDDVLRCGGAVWKMEENRGPHPGADAALYLSWRNAGASALLKSTVQQPVFGADIWGLFSAILTPLLYGTLYYKRATRTGAWAAFVTGVAGTVLLQPRELPVYWGFPVTLCSTLVFVLVPVLESIWKNVLAKGGHLET